jgi:hypothetical protein
MTEEKIGSVSDEKPLKDKGGAGVNLGWHQAQCTICLSSCRQEIDELFVDWVSPQVIADRYTNISRYSVYRHAHACDLFSKRAKNINRALERFIERVDTTIVNGSSIISAIKIYMKLNSAGQGTEQAQGADPKKLFERMSKEEREGFARDGTVPNWFSGAIGATPSDGQGGEKESEVTETTRLQ